MDVRPCSTLSPWPGHAGLWTGEENEGPSQGAVSFGGILQREGCIVRVQAVDQLENAQLHFLGSRVVAGYGLPPWAERRCGRDSVHIRAYRSKGGRGFWIPCQARIHPGKAGSRMKKRSQA